jgi:hypothetical protein
VYRLLFIVRLLQGTDSTSNRGHFRGAGHQQQGQGKLFAEKDAAAIATLRKIPFDFHYRCAYVGLDSVEIEVRHKISDWEAGALYWNVRKKHQDNWIAPFRDMLERELPSKDLIFLMGTMHRFPDQWLIISLIYPPKLPTPEDDLLSRL